MSAAEQLKLLDVIDDLLTTNRDKALQATNNPTLMGWFVGQAMKRLNGEADAEFLAILFRGRIWTVQ